MKKNLKLLGCLSLAVLLTACNGATITREEAATRVDEIIDHQSETDDLYKDGILLKGETKLDDDTATYEYAYHADKLFLHLKSHEKSNNGEEKNEIYMGVIDGRYYAMDVINKKYTKYDSESVFKGVLLTSAAGVLSAMNSITVTAKLLTSESAYQEIDPAKGESILYKSKGEGHLYIEVVKKEESDGKTNTTKSKVVLDQYRFVSSEVTLEGEEKGFNKVTASYNVNPNMPSLNGYKEA